MTNIEQIVNTYRERVTIERYSYVATREEVIENDFNLNITRYVDTFEDEEQIDLETVQLQIDALEEKLISVKQQINGQLNELRATYDVR